MQNSTETCLEHNQIIKMEEARKMFYLSPPQRSVGLSQLDSHLALCLCLSPLSYQELRPEVLQLIHESRMGHLKQKEMR
jgi:hypothetical protein